MNKSTQQKLLYTALIYISICLLFVIGFFVFRILVEIFNIQTDIPTGDSPFLWMVVFLVLGGIGIFGQAGFFVFPFFPLIFINAIIYFIVHLLYKSEKVYKLRKVVKVIVISSVVPIVGFFVVALIVSLVFYIKESNQDTYYWEKYGTEEEVELPYKLIFSSYNNKIYLVDTSGITKTVLYDYSGNYDLQVKYVSPKGSYFINFGFEGEIEREREQVLQITRADSLELIFDINILKSKEKMRYANEPDACAWSNDENFLVCWYNGNPSKIILFDVLKKHYIYIYSNELYVYNASFDQSSNTLYYDYDNSIYKVDNLQEMSQSNFAVEPHITKLENMHACRMVTYDNNIIYCSVGAGEIGKIIEDQDNRLIKGKGFFIIKQDINQKSPEDYQVLNLAPLGGANQLTILSDTHIASGGTIINMQTGRIVKDPPDFGLGGSSDTRAIRYYGE